MSSRTARILAMTQREETNEQCSSVPTPTTNYYKDDEFDKLDYTPEDPFEDSGSQYFPSDESDHDDEIELNNKKKTNKKNKQINTNLQTYKINEVGGTNTLNNELDNPMEKNSELSESNILKDVTIKTQPTNKSLEINKTNENDSVQLNKLIPEISKNTSCTSARGSSIQIRVQIKNQETGTRIRDKIHCCMFCYKLIQQLARHLEIMHSQEMEVARLLALKKKSKERREGFSLLGRVGDYYHNCEVLSKMEGELILVRRPSADEAPSSYAEYGPCPECLGFMLKKHIWHHLKYTCCKLQQSKNEQHLRRNPISESTALLLETLCPNFDVEYRTNIIANMRTDNISLICRQDSLILSLGQMQYEKYHTTQSQLIRQSMRQLGRLLQELRAIDGSKIRLENWLLPINFDTIVAAVRNICCFTVKQNTRATFKIPSLALKLGYNIKKCIVILMGKALRKSDTDHYKQLKNLKQLLEMEWKIKISSNALATLHDRKLNAVELLPVTSDLVKLNKYLNKSIADYKSLLKTYKSNSYNGNTWTNLANLLLAKVILFNKRRSGEISRMTIQQYSTRGNYLENDEFTSSFTPLEATLAKSLTLIQIKGKNGRHVNVLLTPDVKDGIDILINTRDQFAISKENNFIFPRKGPSIFNLRGHDALRKVTSEANLNRPGLVNGTKLRKYIATVCQVFNLTENETDWLARHLGHDIRVHREFYRLQESSVELTKISRILMTIEKGQAHKFKGKSLKEINVTDLPQLDEDEDEDSENEDSEPIEKDKSKPMEEDKLEIMETDKSDHVKTNKSKTKKTCPSEKKKPVRRWSQDEANVVISFFQKEIGKLRVPGKEKCEKLINKYPEILSLRAWRDIKNFVHNHNNKIKKGLMVH